MSDDKRLVRKVYEGEVISSTKVLGVTVKADEKTVQSFNDAVENLHLSIERLKEAIISSLLRKR